jgi:predicted DNA-binding transcriptional regulator AlpA
MGVRRTWFLGLGVSVHQSTEHEVTANIPSKQRPPRFLSLQVLRERGIGLSRVQLWRMVKVDEFPCPVRLTRQRSAWREAEIDHWMATRPLAVCGTEAA